MKCTDFIFQGKDGKSLQGYRWSGKDSVEPKAIIQISHGMMEQGQNYEDFSHPLVEADYVVYANDHRGHGRNVKTIDELGYFAEKGGWNIAVGDMRQLTKIIQRDYPQKPIYLFGYSLGSLLVRDYITHCPQSVVGVILCGTHGGIGGWNVIAMTALKWMMKWKGKKMISPFLNQLSLGNSQGLLPLSHIPIPSKPIKNIPPINSMDSVFYRQHYKISFYYDLLYGLKKVCDPKVIHAVPKDLPIYLFSGEKDPVGDHTKGVLKVYHSYLKAGMKNVYCRFYKNVGHEIYNESNKSMVFKDLIEWLEDNAPNIKK
ncbi:alpha/beta hydrolase [Irregularibacter muris]|uniref:Alpha/beta hydrolase n=1 Tax=Irregularibacter muris TaxID=1796619 RepID=A0AAE3HD97_9FIRM|nr:alpha/beta hydrolase [Irregularibacter muris]MCR1898302.1 alpha/beta hydrolase [Irregularibacter muris]